MKEISANQETIDRGNQRYEERLAVIKPYAEMGMSRCELDFALVIGARKDFSKGIIDDVLVRARKRGELRRLPALEKKLIIHDESTMTDEQMQKGVVRRLVAREILIQRKAEMPKDRAGWNNVMEAMGDVDKPLGIVENLLKRGGSISDATKIAKLEYPETQEPIVRFAQELVEKGMINEDLLNYNQLVRIYRENGIELPTFAHSIVLEAFLVARKALDRQYDSGPISTYNELRGNSLFDEESEEHMGLAGLEDFLAELSINDNQGHKIRVDDIGFYREGNYGEKYRFPISDEGNLIFDNPRITEKRAQSRERVARSR